MTYWKEFNSKHLETCILLTFSGSPRPLSTFEKHWREVDLAYKREIKIELTIIEHGSAAQHGVDEINNSPDPYNTKDL